LDALITTYNQSTIQAVNLASGGATIDNAIVAPKSSAIRTLKQQIEFAYTPTYSQKPSYFPWQAENTIFSLWFGINDVRLSYKKEDYTAINSRIVKQYSLLIQDLYASGARHFLLINVPPVHRSPSMRKGKRSSRNKAKASIKDFNARLRKMSNDFKSRSLDASLIYLDAYKIFTEVLDKPCSYESTCAYKNTTDYCLTYAQGTRESNTYYEECGIPVDEYFWLDHLHPTYRIHDVIASAIAKQLAGVSRSTG